MSLLRIDHIQLAMPQGGEYDARRFYRDLLGLAEIEKPDNLKKRGGCWFANSANQLLDRRDEYRVLGQQGAAIIRERYSIDVCLPKMVELYESVRRKT